MSFFDDYFEKNYNSNLRSKIKKEKEGKKVDFQTRSQLMAIVRAVSNRGEEFEDYTEEENGRNDFPPYF